MSILALDRVTRRFGGLVALDDVSFDVAERGITAIIGPNGAGKTTLFNIVSGSMAPSEGHIRFNGEDITANAPETVAQRGLIRTFQLVRLFENLSVLENVKVGCHLHTHGGLLAAVARLPSARRSEADVEARAHALLDKVGLAKTAETSAAVLPYGQKRLLEIARALAAGPKLLLLDEPAAGLNREETSRLAALLRQLSSEGTAILLIEHDMDLVMNTADAVVVLDFGRKIASGTPDKVRNDPRVITAYLGDAEAVHG